MTGSGDASATAQWDALGRLFSLALDGKALRQDYRYDPFFRRVAKLELADGAILPGSRRYIHDHESVIEERLFEPSARIDDAPSTLERIHVNGRQIDEPLLSAVAVDTPRGAADEAAGGRAITDGSIAHLVEYYYLLNNSGNVMALLDAHDPERLLARYRYGLYGQPISVGTAAPSDTARGADIDTYLHAARRFDAETGLYYYRSRYYEPTTGRFLSRDPRHYDDSPNLYAFVRNDPVGRRDPLGEASCDAASALRVFHPIDRRDQCEGYVHVAREITHCKKKAAKVKAESALGQYGPGEAESKCQSLGVPTRDIHCLVTSDLTSTSTHSTFLKRTKIYRACADGQFRCRNVEVLRQHIRDEIHRIDLEWKATKQVHDTLVDARSQLSKLVLAVVARRAVSWLGIRLPVPGRARQLVGR